MNEIDKYFLKYNNIRKKIFLQELNLETQKENFESISGISYNEKVSSTLSAPKGLEIKLIQIESMEEKIKKLYVKKDRIREKHIEDFKKLSKTDYEIILTCYYLDRVSIKNISIKLDKSIGHIKKLKREALYELINKIIKKDT